MGANPSLRPNRARIIYAWNLAAFASFSFCMQFMVDENWGDGDQHVRVELHYWIQDANFNSHRQMKISILLTLVFVFRFLFFSYEFAWFCPISVSLRFLFLWRHAVHSAHSGCISCFELVYVSRRATRCPLRFLSFHGAVSLASVAVLFRSRLLYRYHLSV